MLHNSVTSLQHTLHWEKRLNFHDYTPYWKGMERYKEGPYFQEIQEIWPFLIPFHTFPIRSIAMEIQSFFPVLVCVYVAHCCIKK